MTPELLIAIGIVALWPLSGLILHLWLYTRHQGFEWANKHEYKALFLSTLLGPKIYWIWKAEKERAQLICDMIMDILNNSEEEEEDDGDSSDS